MMTTVLNYEQVAIQQRNLRFVTLGFIGMVVLFQVVSTQFVFQFIGIVAGFILVVGTANQLMWAEGKTQHTRGAYLVLLFIPFLNILTLLQLHAEASVILKERGLRAGILGMSKVDRLKLREGRCQSCGYDLSGTASSNRCPECGDDQPTQNPGKTDGMNKGQN